MQKFYIIHKKHSFVEKDKLIETTFHLEPNGLTGKTIGYGGPIIEILYTPKQLVKLEKKLQILQNQGRIANLNLTFETHIIRTEYGFYYETN